MNVIEQTLARRYALALLRVCGDRFSSENLLAIKRAGLFFREHKPALYFLALPDFPGHEKKEIVHKLFEVIQLPDCFRNLAVMLSTSNRLPLIAPILQATLTLYQEQHGIMDVEIESASELSDEQLEVIRTFLAERTGKTIHTTHRVEKDLIAGIRLQSDTLLWEYSVRKKLRAIRLSVMR